MTDYTVDDTSYGPDTLANVLAAMETYLETIDNGKTIRLMSVHPVHGDGRWMGAIIIDT